MKPVKQARILRFLMTACLSLVLIAGTSLSVLSAPAGRFVSAEITVSGQGENGEKPFLRLNGEEVLSGRTFFAQSTLETPQNVSAAVNLPGIGRVNLSPGTMLSLGFSGSSITGKLFAGKIRVSAARGIRVNIETPDNRLTNDPSEAGVFSVDLSSGSSNVISETGIVLTGDGTPAGKAQTTGSSPSIWIPLAVYGGIVGAAVVAVLIDRNGDDRVEDIIISPVR